MTRKSKSKPHVVKSGSIIVKIYEGIALKKGKEYPFFTVVYYLHGKRERKSFADLEEAISEAGIIARRIDHGQHNALQLTGVSAEIYATAVKELSALGTPLHEAVREYVNARSILGKRSLTSAAEEVAARSTAGIARKEVGVIVDELLQVQANDGKSKRYLETLRSHLNRFKSAFAIEIGKVSTPQLEAWLSDVGGSNRTRNNLRGSLVTLFQYARRMKYLPRSVATEADELRRVKNPTSVANSYTPAELMKLLQAADVKILPALAIGAFAGLRAASIGRLEWENILWEQSVIEIPAAIAKNGKRYLVPLLPCLAAWLSPYRGKKGRIFPGTRLEHWMAQAFKDANLKRFHNGLRDSFISYRVAQTMNLPQVAYEAGNSVEMIRSKYLEARTKVEADLWFSVFPERPANIVSISA